jgi:glycosyl-4,4'-diaponeurosporenoate acyltransferase
MNDAASPTLMPLLSSVGYWLLLSLLVGSVANGLPPAWLRCPPLRPSGPTTPGIRRWKRWIPDAGPALPGGVRKAALVQRDPQALERLALESRRAEWVHWLLWAGWIPTALWLPPAAVGVNLLFSTAANLPCLLLQRHTRRRVQACLRRMQARVSRR